jgi:hypothetical protein
VGEWFARVLYTGINHVAPHVYACARRNSSGVCARDNFLIHPSLRLILSPLNNRLLPSWLSAIDGGGFAGCHARSSDAHIKGKYAKREWVGKSGESKSGWVQMVVSWIGMGSDGSERGVTCSHRE